MIVMINPMVNAMMNPMNMLTTGGDGGCGCEGVRKHKVPRIPITIDQAKANPMDVRSFLGKPLHTVVDEDALNGKMLQIFTNNETAESFARSSVTSRKSKRQRPPIQPTLTPGVPVG